MSAEPGLLRRIDQTGWPLLAIRIVLGVVFLWMGVNKLMDPVGFLKQVREYHLLPESPPYALNGVAIVLPWLEVWCAAALLAGFWLRGAAVLAVVLLMGFTPAILVRALGIYAATSQAFCDIHFDCGCGSGQVFICRKMLENLTLLLLAVVAVLSNSRRFSLPALLRRGSPQAA